MASFYIVTVRWVETPIHPPLIDGILGLHGDWMRFTFDSWFVFSNENARAISEHVGTPLKPGDSVMVMEINPPNSWGFAPPWTWEWFSARTKLGAQPGVVAQPEYFLPSSK